LGAAHLPGKKTLLAKERPANFHGEPAQSCDNADMSIDTRIGLAGLIVALIGVAATYLWPDKKLIGWICFSLAALLIIGWATLAGCGKTGV
jgi:hypothetical protein